MGQNFSVEVNFGHFACQWERQANCSKYTSWIGPANAAVDSFRRKAIAPAFVNLFAGNKKVNASNLSFIGRSWPLEERVPGDGGDGGDEQMSCPRIRFKAEAGSESAEIRH